MGALYSAVSGLIALISRATLNFSLLCHRIHIPGSSVVGNGCGQWSCDNHVVLTCLEVVGQSRGGRLEVLSDCLEEEGDSTIWCVCACVCVCVCVCV